MRFLWGFRAFFLKRFIGRFGCVVVSEGVGGVRDSDMVSKGRGWTTRTEILCFLFGSDMVAGSWLGGCFGVGKQTEIWRGRWGEVIELNFFYELDAVI